ncbi:GNAT family N-acetyltransferase [Shouchella sp. JSM 1781072]|uniref:GNAT family N-acetyltransferase n=1 Tax=Shouchella sp. JSM 1781072 TaxID=3344581 RepID=UPI0035BED1FC
MIRTIKLAEYAYLADVNIALFHTTTEKENSDIQAIVVKTMDVLKNRENDRDAAWVLEQNEEVVGSIAILEKNEKQAILHSFYIENAYRGKGFGESLMQTAISFCQQRCYQEIVLYVEPNAVPARNRYAHSGFTFQGTNTKTVGPLQIVEEEWLLALT